MTLLAIESATDLVGAALIRDDGARAERSHAGGRAHAELLAPAIEEVCAVSGCAVTDIDRIAVDVGPGLFTGLRVGVATAKALAQALGVGVLGVGSLDVLAAAAAERAHPAPGLAVVSVVDARRGEVFASAYRFDRAGPPADGALPVDPAAVRDDRPVPLAPEALLDWLVALAEEAGTVVVVGDGAVRYLSLLAPHRTLDLDLADELSAPSPLVLAELAARRLGTGTRPVSPVALVPDYRRPADARINWEQRTPAAPGRP
ncbi:MAG: tRNA (adenosine(37)-N6)-threonylcarbamoyltransferase complex dimerization subunit type 1 TsaB [Acidimicrobiales bacterium]